MRKALLMMLAVSSTCFANSMPDKLAAQTNNVESTVFDQVMSLIDPEKDFTPMPSLAEIQKMLHEQAPTLSAAVIDKVMTSLQCANAYNVQHNDILTVIDYSLPSSEKRLWVFDLRKQHLLFYTFVSHGITSGTLLTNYFSNKNNSKASSIGVYTTNESYYGREGLSLRLDGLDRGFNDNASSRSVVMHGGWYVDENFIKKYGRPGRSWGCPALPEDVAVPIINTIKNKSLFVMYYPSDSWFAKSKFLNCNKLSSSQQIQALAEMKPNDEQREAILFADMNKNNQREENEPVVVISADDYQRIFNNTPPLDRMLRRQINHQEYIALSGKEFKTLVNSNNDVLNINPTLDSVYFVIPDIIMVRGYYETQMKVLPLGKITQVEPVVNASNVVVDDPQNYIIHFDKKTVNLKSTNRFIRWLGL